MRHTLGVFLFALISLSGIAAAGSDEFLSLDEIVSGMTGVGRTIVSDNEIESFQVEVIAVLDEPGTANDFIVVRVSGEAIGRSGGISQGMSGSPIYIDDRLVGALSRAAAWSKELLPIGLVTPIPSMLRLLETESDDPFAWEAQPPETFTEASVLLTTNLSSTRAVDALWQGLRGHVPSAANPDGTARTLCALPMWESAGTLIEAGLASADLHLAPIGGTASAAVSGAVSPPGFDPEPGAAVGVALATGDVSIGALGTLTYVKDGSILAFGHPFLASGDCAFPLTTVEIFDTIRAYDASYKLGRLGEPIGTVYADRNAGIAARLGDLPTMITVQSAVRDSDRQIPSTYELQLVDERRLLPLLAYATLLETIDVALDRVGEGTARVVFRVEGNGMEQPLIRHDVFLSSNDIGVYPPWQMADILSFLAYNPFSDPEISRITLEIDVTKELDYFDILSLTLDTDAYFPGETIAYAVTLSSTRHGMRTIEGTLEISAGEDAYFLAVRAYGGSRPASAGEVSPSMQSLGDVVAFVETLPSNDDLTIELFALDPWSPYADAWIGVNAERTTFDGIPILGQAEVIVPLLLDDEPW
ncbi:hypothetical protein JW848_03595 [Candidatus Bipolaricaulota bacterium]|nr:hypothetical protein [Candidatus Bipolaricaulota bacterium]